jgi:DNA repair photolyase
MGLPAAAVRGGPGHRPSVMSAHDPSTPRPIHFVKGRGAGSNEASRFEREARVRPPGLAADAGGDDDEDDDAAPWDRKTEVTLKTARSIISRNESPDLPFDHTINPYQGCEHGCIYCFARPTHAYLGLSPGLDFETKIFAKVNAAELLREELGRRGYVPALVMLGASTDPYQPIERRLGITRGVLQVLAECNVPLTITTKGGLVTRDIDLLSGMAARGRLVRVYMSVSTLDPALARTMDPRATAPQRRLDAIRALTDAGVPVGVFSSPMIPSLNDDELEPILEAAAEAGATYASYSVLRLPLEVRDLFVEWLQARFPDRAARVMAQVRGMRQGKDYDPDFGSRMRGTGAWAEALGQRFRAARARLALKPLDADFDTTLFRPPAREDGQASLF